MNLNDVMNAGPKHTKLRRVGRGLGSGMGKTSTRGQKGHGARESFGGKLGFEGGQMPLFRRLPKRGFTNGRYRVDYAVVNLAVLDKHFGAGDEVTLEVLRAKGLITGSRDLLKVLGSGEVTKAIHVKADAFSEAAAKKIETAGGKAERIA